VIMNNFPILQKLFEIYHRVRFVILRRVSCVSIIIGGFFYIPIFLISPIIKVRVGELESRLIGHFSLPIELYLSDKKSGLIKNKKLYYDIFFFNKKISNKFLEKKWKEIFPVMPEYPWKFLHDFLLWKNPSSSFLIPLRHWKKDINWQIDINKSLLNTDSSIKFSVEEIIDAEKKLTEMGFDPKRPTVCFHVRDSLFHPNPIYNLNKPGPRDSPICIFEPAMNFMVTEGYNVFRVGRKMSTPLSKGAMGVIDYAFNEFQSDMLDIYLMYKSEFIVGTLSGLENVALMFRRPICAINVSEWRVLDNFMRCQIPIFLPKKFIWSKTMNPLTLTEIVNTNSYEFCWNKQFLRSGIEYQNNSPNDILLTVKEMISYVLQQKNMGMDLTKNKICDEFLRIIPIVNGRKITSRIPEFYLQENIHLLK